MAEALRLTWRDIGELRPYGRNPRKNDPAVGKMVRSIGEFGFLIPVLCKSDGEVIDGHLRLKAAKEMGLRKVPVICADGLTEAQVKAFRIQVNQSANWAKWDMPLLRLEIGDLQAEGFDLDLLGFPGAFFADLALSDSLSDPDDWGSGEPEEKAPAPLPPGKAKTPVTAVLGPEDYASWLSYKESVGERSDTKAFVALLKAASA
jgi:hypothetical protein